MTEEEKKAAAEAEAKKNKGKTDAEIATEKEVAEKAAKEKEALSDPNKVDYKAEAEKLKKQNEQAGHNIEDERGKRLKAEADVKKLEEEAKELAKESGKSIEEAKEELKVANQKQIDSIREGLLKDVVTEELDLLISNEEEKELVKLIYDRDYADKVTDRKSIKDAMENARIIANKPRFKNALDEVNAANKSKNSLGGADASNAENAEGEIQDPKAKQIESEMSGDLPAGFK